MTAQDPIYEPQGQRTGGGRNSPRNARSRGDGGGTWYQARFRKRTRSGWMAFVRGEDGAATAEYAVATMAAVGFAGLLVVILRGDEVRGVLTDLVRRALSTDL